MHKKQTFLKAALSINDCTHLRKHLWESFQQQGYLSLRAELETGANLRASFRRQTFKAPSLTLFKNPPVRASWGALCAQSDRREQLVSPQGAHLFMTVKLITKNILGGHFRPPAGGEKVFWKMLQQRPGKKSEWIIKCVPRNCWKTYSMWP